MKLIQSGSRDQRRKAYQSSGSDARLKAFMGARRLSEISRPMFTPTRPETKGCDIEINSSGVLSTTNTNAGMFTLNLISPGTGSYNRIGRKIQMKSVRLYGIANMVWKTAATTGAIRGNTLRIVVVFDQQPSGAVPTFDTIFGHTLQDATESTSFLDPIKYDSMGRFKILRDERIDSNPTFVNDTGGTVDSGTNRCHFDIYIKLGNLETVYSGQSSPCTIADVSTGALYVWFRAEEHDGNISQWTIDTVSFARLRYQDNS